MNSHISSWQNAVPFSRSSFWQPDYVVQSAWLEHGPFLSWLIDVLRPESFVELGCHTGYSYFIACQTVKRLGLSTSCYAVDTWRGDEHAGFYGEEVFSAVNAHNEQHYGAFSRLVRATFEDAAPSFADRSVALLHIDGRHFYLDVAADFETWRPKLSNDAIVLFHDTNVRDRDFGVWKFFGELSERYPSFEFLHGNGLGIVAMGAVPAQLAAFFGASDEAVTLLRTAYATLGQAVTRNWQLGELSAALSHNNATLAAAEARLAAAEAAAETRLAAAEAAAGAALAATQAKLAAAASAAEANLAVAQANERRLAETAQETDRKVADQLAALSLAETRVRSLTDSLAAIESEKAVLKANIAGIEALGASLRAENADLKARLEREVRLRRLDLSRLETEKQNSRDAIFEVRELRSNTAQLERRVAQLDTEVARRQSEIDSMFASTSWCISGPVRWLGRRAPVLTRGSAIIRFPFRFSARAVRFAARGWRDWGHRRFSDPLSTRPVPTGALSHSPVEEVTGHVHGDPYEDIARQLFAEQQAEVDRAKAVVTIGEFCRTPLISVIMPVYKTPVQWLRRAVESLQEQYYDNWELCVVDDCSPGDEQRTLLAAMAAEDDRIRLQVMEKNGGISAASNAALAMARGEFIALVDHDDELTPDAFYWIASEINKNPDADFIYSDECKIDDTAQRRLFDFIFKPDWSPEIMFNGMVTGHLTVYGTGVVRKIGGFRSDYDFSQDYDLALRMSEVARKIVHVERVLYMWRAIPGSAASGGKVDARISNIAALNEALARRSIPGDAIPLDYANRVRIELPNEAPLVSIIIPSDSIQNLRLVLDSIRGKTDYPNYEILVVCNGPLAERLSDEFDNFPQLGFVHYNKKYNFSDKCNEGARAANGEFVIFYNDDVFPIQSDWIERLIEFLYVPGVEGVSPQLLYENNTIQYAGMISGTPGLVGTAYHGMAREDGDSFLMMYRYVRNVSILSGACCALRKDVFLAVGGFDSINTPDGHSDLDLSFKLLRAGYRCVYTPSSVLHHIGNHSWHARRGKYKADIFMLKRWGAYVSRDPNFTSSMKRVLYRDFRFDYRVFASHIDPGAIYEGPDVLFVSHELSLTGAPRMLFYAAVAVRERGGFPVVVAPMDGPIRAELEAAGITVIVDASVHDCHFLFERFARNFDLVVVNTIALANVVQHLCAIDGLGVVWWVHEAQAIAHEEAIKQSQEWGNFRLLCNSEYSCAYFPAGAHAEVLHYGIPDKRDAVRVPSPPERMTFVLSGTLEHRKGQDIFVDAVASLPKHVRENCEFLITGKLWENNHPYWDSVQATMAALPEVQYLGLLNHREMLDLIARCDVLVCCSRDEPFSLVALEAAMLGKSSILSSNVGAGDVFGPKGACAIFESGNALALSQLMLDAFEDRDALDRMGQIARQVFEREFTLEAFSERFFRIVLHGEDAAESVLA